MLMKKFIDYASLLFLKIFYRKIQGANPYHVFATVFFTQKILGFSRFVPWPVHHSSRILYRKNITVGPGSFPGWMPGCYIQARNGIVIGCNVRIGPNVGLISANHSPDDFDSWTKTRPITIGDNVWIGMNTTILAGVRIGNNVIIGANSVVTKDIPDNSISAGNPCSVIKRKGPYLGRQPQP